MLKISIYTTISLFIIAGTFLIYAEYHAYKFVKDPMYNESIFENSSINEVDHFIMDDNLACKILISTKKDDENTNITLTGLMSNSPLMIPESGGTFNMKAIYNDEEEIIIQMISLAGGVDTILVNKKTGVFVRSAMGSFIGEYIIANKGYCN